MKMAKRAFLILLCFLTLISFGACGQKTQSAPSTASTTTVPAPEYTEEKELLLQHWKDYLAATENIYAHMNWALSYMKAYAENNDWSSYLKAHAACSAALRYIRDHNYKLAYTITDEQSRALDSIGIQTDSVQAYYLAFESSQAGLATTLKLLSNNLQSEQYYRSLNQQFGKKVEKNLEQISLMSSFYCLDTNYLLLNLGMDSQWDTFLEEYPTLSKGKVDWISDKDALETEANKVLDLYESSLSQNAEQQGVSEYINKLIEEAYSTHKLENLHKEIQIPENCPGYLPIPDFLLTMDYDVYYSCNDPETEKTKLISSGQIIDKVPDNMLVNISGVAKEAVEQYAAQLKARDFDLITKWNEEDRSYVLLVAVGDGTLMVKWTAEETAFYLSDEICYLLPELILLTLDALGQP